MQYINYDRLEELDSAEFLARKPWPWAMTDGLLTDDGFDKLREGLPDVSIFTNRFGEERKGGQAPHDRYSLEFTPEVAPQISQPWREFIDELCDTRYRENMRRLLGGNKVEFRFHWHYTPSSCAVSPHCDAAREHGSHLWYLNSEDDWKAEWGGQTVVLDDGGKFKPRSAPAFEDFDDVATVPNIGNRSFFFARRSNGWHGVREIECPEGYLRKVFIVVVNPNTLFYKVRDKVKGKNIQRY